MRYENELEQGGFQGAGRFTQLNPMHCDECHDQGMSVQWMLYTRQEFHEKQITGL